MSISRLPPFPSFLPSSIPICLAVPPVRPSASVRPSVNAATALISVLSRCGCCRLQRRLPRSAPRPSSPPPPPVRRGFGVDYFFRRRSCGRARQTLDLSAAPTATDAAVDQRTTERERGQPRAKATMNSFPPSFLHSDRSLPQSTSTYEIAYFFKNAEGTSASARWWLVGLFSDFGSAEMVRKGKGAGKSVRQLSQSAPELGTRTSCYACIF